MLLGARAGVGVGDGRLVGKVRLPWEGGVLGGAVYLVSRRFVRDVLGITMDVVHRVGLRRDVFVGSLGDGVVVDLVCHGVCCCEMLLQLFVVGRFA